MNWEWLSEWPRRFLHAQFGSGWWGIQDPAKQLELAKAWKARGDNSHTSAMGVGARGLLGLARLKEAIAAYKKALLFRPDFAEAQYELGVVLFVLATNSYEDRDCLGDAVTALRDAIRLKPNLADAHFTLGLALEKSAARAPATDEGKSLARQQREEAIAAYQRALHLKADSPDRSCRLCWALWSVGREEEAVAVLRKAIELSPDYAPAYLELGKILERRDDNLGALGAYQKALLIKLDYEDAIEALKELIFKLSGCMEEERHKAFSAGILERWESLEQVAKRLQLPAVWEYLNSLAVRPYEASAYRALARLLEATGSKDEAMKVLDIAANVHSR